MAAYNSAPSLMPHPLLHLAPEPMTTRLGVRNLDPYLKDVIVVRQEAVGDIAVACHRRLH